MLRVKMKSVTMAILLTLRHPIIVLMYALLYAGGIAYAHNGSSELSKDDRQQCDKMVDILKNYYETQGGRLNLQKQGYVLEHMPIYKIKPDSYISYHGEYADVDYSFDWTHEDGKVSETSEVWLIRKNKKNIGITPIYHEDHSGHNNPLYEYRKGYLFDIVDYIGEKNMKKNDFYLYNPEKFKEKLNFAVFVSEGINKKQLDLRIRKFKMPYVKIRYCYVEEYRK